MHNQSKNMVAITGIGLVSMYGTGWKDAIQKIMSSIYPFSNWPEEYHPVRKDNLIGLVKDYKKEGVFSERQLRLIDKGMAMSGVAADLAIKDAKLEHHFACSKNTKEIATVLGTARGEMASLIKFGKNVVNDGNGSINPALFPTVARNVACGQIAIKYGLRGWSSMMASGELAGLHSIIRGASLIRSGRAKIAVTGAFETLSKFTLHHSMLLYDKHLNNERPSFFGDEAGLTIPSEGACIIIMEELSHALERGAIPYAIVSAASQGYTALNFAANDLSRGLENIIKKSGHNTELDFIVTSQSGAFNSNDQIEQKFIIDKVYRNQFYKPILTASRSLFGEMESVNGVLQIAVAAQAIRNKNLLPTINISTKKNPELSIKDSCGETDLSNGLVTYMGLNGGYCMMKLQNASLS